MSRPLRYGMLLALALGGVLLFMLAAASGNTQAFARNYPVLLAINGVIAALLFVLVVALVLRVARRWRARRFGARLMARFALAFALMGVVPGVLIYVVSVQFLSRSIESWFDVRVDRALESGLSLGRAVLESQLADLTNKARAIAGELADMPELPLQTLDRMRERAGVHEALVLGAGGQVLAASGALGPTGALGTDLMPSLPTAAALRQARVQRSFQAIEGDELSADPQTGLRTRVIVPIPAASLPAFVPPPAASQRSPLLAREGAGDARADKRGELRDNAARPPPRPEARYLQLVQRVSPSVAAHAEALRSGYREHQELSLARTGLRRIYTVTLTLTLLLAVFAAIASGVLLASSMTAPLLQVAEGTKAVAEGDYRPVREFRGNDELNVLTQSFNAMTRQLTEARDAVEARSRELENARAYLERVLGNLSAGVIVLDNGFRLVSANHGASRILGVPMASRTGERFGELVPIMADQVAGAFADQALSATPKDSWQQQLQVPRAGSATGAEPLALLARGSRLPLEGSMGYVIVFDDITQVISAQRALAWGEVARRLAHEIKNPLTPIQLAAERLRMKLADKLPPEQAEVLVRGASTIVNQVAAMKRMVDDFRDYARVPPARLQPLDLNVLITEIAALYGVDGGTSGYGSAPVSGSVAIELKLAGGLPKIEGDPTQLRQVLHNLIVNAQDALANSARADGAGGSGEAAGGGCIVVRTSLVTIDERTAPRSGGAEQGARAVRLTIEDNGPGFPANILRRAFEPYVTTKPSGTGLGLAMVKKIVDEHGARVELVNRAAGTAGGATVIIVFRRLVQDAAREDSARASQRAA